MTDTDEPQYRTYHQAAPGDVHVREDGEDGVFSVRMPLVTTGEVRNQGDEPFAREEIAGMADQINEGTVGVFLDHGQNLDVAAARYSATEKVGEWRDAEVEDREDGESQVTADAVMMDPETLPADTASIREALATIKAQAERGFALSSSIGWREDESAPGGNDLMETSIVGIPADPRTTQDEAVAMARDVLADSDLDDDTREELVAQFRAVVMGPDPNDEREHSMTDEDTESGDEPDDTNDSEDGLSAAEFRERMLDLQEQQMDTLETVANAIDSEDQAGDDKDDDEDDDEEQDADEPDDQQNPEGEQDSDDVDELRDAYDTLREGGIDVDDVALPDDQQDADDTEQNRDANEPTFSFTEADE